jgi:hypothetical protein
VTLEESLRIIDSTAPDVTVPRVRMPPDHSDEGLRIAETLRGRYPRIGLALLSTDAEAAYAERPPHPCRTTPAGGLSAQGTVGNLTEQIEAPRRVGSGDAVIDQYLLTRLMSRRRSTLL